MEGRRLEITEDGSHTLYWEKYRQWYHSTHGAWQESIHVFFSAGLHALKTTDTEIRIFEMGFGTALNPLLALLETEATLRPIRFTSIEAFPLEPDEYHALNFGNVLSHPRAAEWLKEMHEAGWEKSVEITDRFVLRKLRKRIEDWEPDEQYHIIFYDAFAPGPQPELWTEEIFSKLYKALLPGGMLTTYCAKGVVKRALRSVGFHVEALPGAMGKREMTRATKPA